MDLGRLFRHAWELFVKDIGQLLVGMLIATAIPGGIAAVIIFLMLVLAIPGFASGAQAGQLTGLGVMSVVALVLGFVAMFAVMLLVGIPLYAGVLVGVLRRVREGRMMSFWDAFSGFHVLAGVVSVSVLAYLLVPFALLVVPVAVVVLGAVVGSIPVIVVGALATLAVTVLVVYLGVCWTYALPVMVDRSVGACDALRESRALVHDIGWWWTVLALFLLQFALMMVALVAGFIPLAGAAVGLFTAPFSLTYLVAMYFQMRREEWLVDVALAAGAPVPAPAPAISGPAAPDATGVTWPQAPPQSPEEAGPPSE